MFHTKYLHIIFLGVGLLLVVFCQDFVKSLGMLAGRAYFRRFRTLKNITAVGTVPFDRRLLLEYLSIGDIADKLTIPGFMELFYLRDLFE